MSAILDEFAVGHRECRREMAVNIEFAGHLAAHKDRNHNLGLGFERAGEIRESVFTSSTTTVLPVDAAAPQIPWFRGMRVCGVIAPR